MATSREPRRRVKGAGTVSGYRTQRVCAGCPPHQLPLSLLWPPLKHAGEWRGFLSSPFPACVGGGDIDQRPGRLGRKYLLSAVKCVIVLRKEKRGAKRAADVL